MGTTICTINNCATRLYQLGLVGRYRTKNGYIYIANPDVKGKG